MKGKTVGDGGAGGSASPKCRRARTLSEHELESGLLAWARHVSLWIAWVSFEYLFLLYSYLMNKQWMKGLKSVEAECQ